MKKACPIPTRPRSDRKIYARDEWERQLDNYDRTVRRRNRKYREHVIRIDHMCVALITSDYKLPLSRLNGLEPTSE